MQPLIPDIQRTSASPPASPGALFCAAAGIAADLAEQMILDGTGRPIAPVALAASDDPAELAAQFELLTRPEAVGGGEALMRDNGERIGDAALARLHRRLAAGAEVAALRPFLEDLRRELSRRSDPVEQRLRELERELHTCQTALRGWQTATSHEPGLLRNLVGWIFGGADRPSLPRAVALWNERERLALARHAWATAHAVIGRLADEVDTLLERQDALLRAAERALRAARGRLVERRPWAECYAPWTWQGSPAVIADQLVGQAGGERLLAALLAQITADGAVADLAALVRALAEGEAATIVGGLTLAGAIEAEAADTASGEIDPLVLVGQGLLSDLEQHRPWRLRRGARPRVDVVQVTGSGEPLFQLDGLGAAAYGDGADRLGFVRLESGIASDDLWAMHEGAEAFAQILSQRNLYVLEDLAREAAPAQSLPHMEVPASATTPNGLHSDDDWRSGDG